MLARLLLDPHPDVKRLHGGDRCHALFVAPGQKLRRRVAVGPPRVWVADVGREEFQEAARSLVLMDALNVFEPSLYTLS